MATQLQEPAAITDIRRAFLAECNGAFDDLCQAIQSGSDTSATVKIQVAPTMMEIIRSYREIPLADPFEEAASDG